MDSDLFTAIPYLIDGLYFTLQVTAVGMVGGIICGSLLAVAYLSPNKTIALIAASYVNIIRSIPLILVLFWIFFLAPWAVGWLSQEGRPVPVGPTLTAFATFVLFEAAYYAEVIRSGLRSVSSGQNAACSALGLSKRQCYICVIFPQAIRNVIPIILTQTIVLFQDTSLVYVISATDLLGAATHIAQRDGNIVQMYLLAGAFYFVISFTASQLVTVVQAKLAYGKYT